MKKWLFVCATMLCMMVAGNLLAESVQQNVAVGDILTFGHYEQDNDQQNGREPIEWVVLDIQNNQALLLTRYAIDSRYYHPGNGRLRILRGRSHLFVSGLMTVL